MMRRILLFLGMFTLAALWVGPLPELARHSFAAHMAMHMGVVAVAAPLIAFGIAGGALDPVCRKPTFFPPIPWSLAELVVVWAWHAPALHHFARSESVGRFAEQGMFFLSGMIVWLSAIGGGGALRGERSGAGIAALLMTSMHMTLLGALLALTPRVLYSHDGHGDAVNALDDQHLGGAIMLFVGGVTYLAGGLWLTAGLVRAKTAKQEVRA